LHHHAISSVLSNEISKTHRAWILSCFGLRVGTWFTFQLIFLAIWLSSPFFLQHFERDLDYIILQLQVSFNACAHISLTLWVSTSYIVFMAMNPRCNSQHLCCHYAKCWFPCGMRTTTCVSFNHVQFLSLTIQHCAHQKWHLHFSQCCHY